MLQAQQYRGMMGTASGIVREEGVSKLWRGVTPALYRHVVYRYNWYIKKNILIDDDLFSG